MNTPRPVLHLMCLALAACTQSNPGVGNEARVTGQRGTDASADARPLTDAAAPTDSATALPTEADAAPEPPEPDAAPGPPEPDAATPPQVTFYVQTTTAEFPHADGLAGQTAAAAFQGIRSFTLLRGADDPEPLVVLDLGETNVEAGYNDGNATLIGTAPLAAVRPGHYTLGRNVVTHSRYRVDATMHVGALALPGQFDNIQVLTNGTIIDGAARPQGWFRYVFRAGGMEYPLEGMGAPLPTDPTAAGFALVSEGGVAHYDYPLDLTIGDLGDSDLQIVLEVNMDHAFRWSDQDQPGYAPRVFDATPQGSEPVRRFGANSMHIRTN